MGHNIAYLRNGCVGGVVEELESVVASASAAISNG